MVETSVRFTPFSLSPSCSSSSSSSIAAVSFVIGDETVSNRTSTAKGFSRNENEGLSVLKLLNLPLISSAKPDILHNNLLFAPERQEDFFKHLKWANVLVSRSFRKGLNLLWKLNALCAKLEISFSLTYNVMFSVCKYWTASVKKPHLTTTKLRKDFSSINSLIGSSKWKGLPRTLHTDSHLTKQYQVTSSGSSSLFTSSMRDMNCWILKVFCC